MSGSTSDDTGWNYSDDRSLVGRWVREGSQPTIDSIRAVCAAFRRDIREGLIAAGRFTAEELKVGTPVPQDLRSIPDDQLLARRPASGPTTSFWPRYGAG